MIKNISIILILLIIAVMLTACTANKETEIIHTDDKTSVKETYKLEEDIFK